MSAADTVRHNAIDRTEWRWVTIASVLILTATAAPNLFGYLVTPAGMAYGGFAYNWQDANSYLAKLMEGLRGEWLYVIPFTADPGNGVLLYPNYLLLGHIARWTNLEPVVVFHLARLASSAVLLVSLYSLMARFFARIEDRRFAFLLAAVGSGLGWIGLLNGVLLPDVLNAELFPFLAMLANPHFPLAMAAFLWAVDALVPGANDAGTRGTIALSAGALVLAITQPYGSISAALIGAGWVGIRWVRERQLPRRACARLVLFVALSMPFALYDVWAVSNNTALAGWTRQNITVSPPVWQWLVSGGPVLALALWAVPATWRAASSGEHIDPDAALLLLWIAVTAGLAFVPGPQQRRLAFTFFVPLAVLAVCAWKRAPRLNSGLRRTVLIGFASLTNVVLLAVAFLTLALHPPYLYFTGGEWQALLFLREQADPRGLVLASPDMGLYIPAYGGQRVLYGHPHETPEARARATEVTDYFAGRLPDAAAYLAAVDYIFVGPRERALGVPVIPREFRRVFAVDNVSLYRRTR